MNFSSTSPLIIFFFSGTQVGSTFKGPATKGGQEILFASTTGISGKYVIVRQDKGIITFAEVQVNPGSYKDYIKYMIEKFNQLKIFGKLLIILILAPSIQT